MISKIEQDFFYLLRCGIKNEEPDPDRFRSYTADDFRALYQLSVKHSVQNICSFFLGIKGLARDEMLQNTAKNTFLLGFQRIHRLDYETRQICDVLEAEGIDYIPLKGAVIRELYPERWMRSSCDIDVLVREEDLERASSALVQKLNAISNEKCFHDVPIWLPSGTHLELHFSIKENIESIDRVLGQVWKYAHPVEHSHRYAMEPEFFLFHHLAHASYHFQKGGCGVRILLDWYLLRKKLVWNDDDYNDILKAANLSTFAHKIDALTSCCFDGAPFMDSSDMMCRFILNGGTYGTKKQAVMVDTVRSGSSISFLFRRLFPSLKHMSILYPILNRCSVLLPVFWIIRAGRLLNKEKRKSSLNEMQYTLQATDAEADETRTLLSALGLEEA